MGVGSLHSPESTAADSRRGLLSESCTSSKGGTSKKNRWSCEIIAWKNVTNTVIDLQANPIPGISVNLLVTLVKIPVNVLVKLTKLG